VTGRVDKIGLDRNELLNNNEGFGKSSSRGGGGRLGMR